MKQMWKVTLPWAWNGEARDEEGTYTASVPGQNEEEARRNAAVEMADSGEKVFLDDGDRQSYIDSRVSGWGDVYLQQQQLRQDLASTFEDELFPDGVRRTINMEALGQLLAENRQTILA